MLDSIYIGMTGLLGYSRGLKVIANNTANMNTPGFKSSSLQFSDLFYSSDQNGSGIGGQSSGSSGHGLATAGTTLSFKQGELRQTGNSLDMAVDGDGMFVLKNANGDLTYTRAGQFEFNTDGVLINRTSGAKVMGQAPDGGLAEITISGLKTGVGKATTSVSFTGNLSSTGTEQLVNGIKVVDSAGGEHLLNAKFTNTNTTSPGSWKVDLLDGTTSIGTGQIVFVDGKPVLANSTVALNYSPAGVAVMPLTLDFSKNVTSFASAGLSTLAVASQDGYGAAGLTKAAFDNAGVLVLTYANGQTSKGNRLAMAMFDSPEAVAPLGTNEFSSIDGRALHIGAAGTGQFGKIQSGMVEISNVDLSQEFGDLVIMQRGYQASSQIVSTANDMLQELFAMKGK